jgi:predicted glycoside hydrolase/deacetylase ChbG (UPF0249 family)
MHFPTNILANADDFGYSDSVNKAILFCFENEYINSTTLLTNTAGFEQAVQMVKDNACIHNIGVHINLAEGLPLSDVGAHFIKNDGTWDLGKTGRVKNFFTKAQNAILFKEISAQINKAIAFGVPITHMDSHYHLHTLPGLHNLFLHAAKQFNLKLRLAQTYREGSYLKYWYRMYINNRVKSNSLNYTCLFESVDQFLKSTPPGKAGKSVEIMLHPDFDASGNLTDHYDKATMVNWLKYLKQLRRN